MKVHHGGCLCGAIRYETQGDPLRVTVCHCRFCQRATGSAYMVEPVFHQADFRITHGTPATYDQRSEGSGKRVTVHFCVACGTKLHLTFERFGEAVGLYGGTYDDPDWFEVGPGNAKHVFVEVARPDTILPPHVPCFGAHAITNDGLPLEPVVFDQPRVVGRRS